MKLNIEAEWERYRRSTCVRRHGIPAPREIYCIGEAAGLPVKIGAARSPADRLKTLNRATWRQLTVYWSVPGLNFHERLFHSVLASRCIHGEWFEDGDDLIKAAPICGGDTDETERLIRWLAQRSHSEVNT